MLIRRWIPHLLFFSSRRRHTRFSRDWSSDVCSSDLATKTVYENVAFALEVIGRPRNVVKAQVPAILELVGLESKADNLPEELSGGEQQRVSIARAFVNRPLILLADEPTGNLDPATPVGIMRLLDRINRTGTTVVMATHDRWVVDTMQRRVIGLEHGRVGRDQARGLYQ